MHSHTQSAASVLSSLSSRSRALALSSQTPPLWNHEEGRKYVRRVGRNEKSCEKWNILYYGVGGGGSRSIPLLEGSQASPPPAAQQAKESGKFQSSKFLLGLASTVVLGFGLRRGPWQNFCSFQDRLCVLKWGLFFKWIRGWSFWIGATSVAP
jgi:hypothetical protein